MIGNLGGWLEAIALVGFVAANFAVVFVALWWALGKPDEPPVREARDRGAMTATGVPYVPGPPIEPERTARSSS